MERSCNTCKYLSKRPGAGNYFIYKCSYWGLVTQKALPQSIVINSIGKPCPFHILKTFSDIKENKNSKSDNNASGLDIII